MTKTDNAALWVVYRTDALNKSGPTNVICSQREWDALEATRPGLHTLVRAGITNEGEAERLARGTAGDPIRRAAPKDRPAAVAGHG